MTNAIKWKPEKVRSLLYSVYVRERGMKQGNFTEKSYFMSLVWETYHRQSYK